MKLSEIKGQVDPSWVQWIKENTQSKKTSILDYIEYEDDKPVLHVRNMDLQGSGQALTPVPFQIIVEEILDLTDYDFENSVFSNITAKSVDMNHVSGDLQKVIEAVKGAKPDTVLIYSKRGSSRNLVAAMDVHGINNLEIIITKSDPPHSPLVIISNWDSTVMIDNEYHEYKDVFDLQQILVDNGFEDMA